MIQRISPRNDLAFKKVFSEPCNKDILQGLINDFFGINLPLGDITIEAPYSIKAYQEFMKGLSTEKLRETIADIFADIKFAGFGAEVQVRKEPFFSQRSLRYIFDKFSGNYNKQGAMQTRKDGSSIRHSSLKPVYGLNILAYPHFPDEDALRVFTLYDRKRNKAFEIEYITAAYFELTKKNVETDNQRHWQRYFTSGEVAADAPDYIKKAAQVIEVANLTREEREMIDRMDVAHDTYENTVYAAYLDGKDEGVLEGKKEGKKEGREEERSRIVQNALKKNMSLEDIADLAELTVEEVKKLIN